MSLLLWATRETYDYIFPTLLKLIIIKNIQKASKILFNVKQNNSSAKIHQVLFLENTWSMLYMHKWKM